MPGLTLSAIPIYTETQVVEIDYTNWRGERRIRRIKPYGFYVSEDERFGHLGEWVCWAFDEQKQEPREFAQSGIHSWKKIGLACEL